MPTKTKTPDQLRADAERLAIQAAEAQAKVDAASLAEYEREQAAQRDADQQFIDTFDAAALDHDVDTALDQLRQTITESPIVQAHAAYLAAQWLRNRAHSDLTGARGRLGLPTAGARPAGTDDANVQELIDTTVQREAQRQVDAHRQEQSR